VVIACLLSRENMNQRDVDGGSQNDPGSDSKGRMLRMKRSSRDINVVGLWSRDDDRVL